MEVIGNCGKHPGQSMINCPLCAIEQQKILSKKTFFVVEYAGYFNIQTTPFYDTGKNILDADAVGYEEAKKYGELIENLLNKYYDTQTD